MLKAVLLLVILSVFGLAATWKSSPKMPPKNSVEILSNSSISAVPETLGTSTTISTDLAGWVKFEDAALGIRVKFPEGSGTKKEIDRSLTISKELVKINISLENLTEKDTVNTVAEADINLKINKLGEKFKLIDSISPIAIGQLTGVTFTTMEEDREISYYYVPLENKFILIKDFTDQSLVSVSDNIIYSLEIL